MVRIVLYITNIISFFFLVDRFFVLFCMWLIPMHTHLNGNSCYFHHNLICTRICMDKCLRIVQPVYNAFVWWTFIIKYYVINSFFFLQTKLPKSINNKYEVKYTIIIVIETLLLFLFIMFTCLGIVHYILNYIIYSLSYLKHNHNQFINLNLKKNIKKLIKR